MPVDPPVPVPCRRCPSRCRRCPSSAGARARSPPVPVPPVPPSPVPVPPVPVVPPVPLPPVQLPLLQVWPEPHLLPQLPQLVVVVMSTQLPLQSFWPESPQPQVPLTASRAAAQTVPQVPQSAESLFELHAPSEHLCCPTRSRRAAAVAVADVAAGQVPQLRRSWSCSRRRRSRRTRRSPPAQTQLPDGSCCRCRRSCRRRRSSGCRVCTLMQAPLHSSWPE